MRLKNLIVALVTIIIGLGAGIAVSQSLAASSAPKIVPSKVPPPKFSGNLGPNTIADIVEEVGTAVVNIDVELRADEGIEVEELTPKRVDEILRPVADSINNETTKPKSLSEDETKLAGLAQKIYPNINESLEAIGLDNDEKEVFKFPINELVEKLSSQSDAKYLILDGIITQRLLDTAKQIGVEFILGHKIAKLENTGDLILKTFTELNVN